MTGDMLIHTVKKQIHNWKSPPRKGVDAEPEINTSSYDDHVLTRTCARRQKFGVNLYNKYRRGQTQVKMENVRGRGG